MATKAHHPNVADLLVSPQGQYQIVIINIGRNILIQHKL
jgi:hypothetical protein